MYFPSSIYNKNIGHLVAELDNIIKQDSVIITITVHMYINYNRGAITNLDNNRLTRLL
jgi:hypothetical protein